MGAVLSHRVVDRLNGEMHMKHLEQHLAMGVFSKCYLLLANRGTVLYCPLLRVTLSPAVLKGLANFETFRTKRELGTESIIGVFFFFFFFKKVNFNCAGSLLLRGLFSSCGAPASHCGGFSCCGAWVLGLAVSDCGCQSLEHRLRSYGSWA